MMKGTIYIMSVKVYGTLCPDFHAAAQAVKKSVKRFPIEGLGKDAKGKPFEIEVTEPSYDEYYKIREECKVDGKVNEDSLARALTLFTVNPPTDDDSLDHIEAESMSTSLAIRGAVYMGCGLAKDVEEEIADKSTKRPGNSNVSSGVQTLASEPADSGEGTP